MWSCSIGMLLRTWLKTNKHLANKALFLVLLIVQSLSLYKQESRLCSLDSCYKSTTLITSSYHLRKLSVPFDYLFHTCESREHNKCQYASYRTHIFWMGPERVFGMSSEQTKSILMLVTVLDSVDKDYASCHNYSRLDFLTNWF